VLGGDDEKGSESDGVWDDDEGETPSSARAASSLSMCCSDGMTVATDDAMVVLTVHRLLFSSCKIGGL